MYFDIEALFFFFGRGIKTHTNTGITVANVFSNMDINKHFSYDV